MDTYDTFAGRDEERLAFMFEEPERAVWLGVGLRMPMVRTQLGWLLWVLREYQVGASSTIVDVGAGAGFTAAALSKAVGAGVHAIDPQPGSADATLWIADRLGTAVEVRESTLDGWVLPDRAAPDVVLSQAVLWYLEPDLDREGDSLAALMASPPQPGPSMATFLDLCSQGRHVLVMDHDFADHWVLVVAGLRERGMFADWARAEVVDLPLPGRDDRQLSVPFTREQREADDAAELRTLLGLPSSHGGPGSLLHSGR